MQNYSVEYVENTVNDIVGQNLDFLQEYANIRPDGFNKALFSLSMIRLKASFEVAMLLMRNGYYIELSSVFRLIFEQLSWECYLFSVNEIQTGSNLTKLKSPQETVSYLKTALQMNIYGQVYGLLSKGTHLPVKEIMRYIDRHAGDNKVDIILQSEEVDSDDISMLLLLIGTYVEVTYLGINHFGLNNKAQEDDFKKRYADWYKGVVIRLSELMLSNDPLIADQ